MPIHANWQASANGAAGHAAFEFPLYSDSRFVAEVREEAWPYSFLNMLPSRKNGNSHAAVVVRVSVHAKFDSHLPYPSPSSIENYHGGWIADEIAALASLALGARFKAGDISRRFDFGDPLGWPCSPRSAEPALMWGSGNFVIPGVVIDGDLRDLIPRVGSIPLLTSSDCVALVRAARLYQDALWIAESEPNLAWLLLVSAMEAAANHWKEASGTAVERLQDVMPQLAERVFDEGGAGLLEFVAANLAPLVGSTKKFVNFAIQHLPEPPKVRPLEPYLQVEWTPTGLRKILRKVYDYRSKSLHGGTPFPGPMCDPPERLSSQSPLVEVGTMALAVSTNGGYWDCADLPINLNTFHYLARGVLLRWWDSLAANH